MGLLDEARKKPKRPPGPRCTVAHLPPKVRADLEKALDACQHEGTTYPMVAEALEEKYKIRISTNILGRHARRNQSNGCGCGPR